MDTTRMKKHVGYLDNTGVRCVVVFRQVPDDPENCLLVETDRLPDMYHEGIMNAVNSPEAKETNDFYEILNRRNFSDGTNCLQALHAKNFLRKIPVSQVILSPFPGHKLPLALLNAELDGTVDDYNKKASETPTALAEEAAKVETEENQIVAEAKSLLLQADLMEAEAASKRDQAYALAPELKESQKKKRGRPKLSEAERAERAEQRKIKRRERDRARAAERREAAKQAELQSAVDKKVMRDAGLDS
jgi:hypothetical protein